MTYQQLLDLHDRRSYQHNKTFEIGLFLLDGHGNPFVDTFNAAIRDIIGLFLADSSLIGEIDRPALFAAYELTERVEAVIELPQVLGYYQLDEHPIIIAAVEVNRYRRMDWVRLVRGKYSQLYREDLSRRKYVLKSATSFGYLLHRADEMTADQLKAARQKLIAESDSIYGTGLTVSDVIRLEEEEGQIEYGIPPDVKQEALGYDDQYVLVGRIPAVRKLIEEVEQHWRMETLRQAFKP